MRLPRYLLLLLALVWLASPTPVWAQAPCTHYASPNGTGTGASQGSPFKISNFLALSQATLQGKVLCLLPGTYQGDTNLFPIGHAATGKSGTSSAPITVRALSEATAGDIPVLDGQHARRPLDINAMRWWVFEGLNVKRGGPGGSTGNGSAISVRAASQNITTRRLVAWDGTMDVNASAVTVSNSGTQDILFEDFGQFGPGRKGFSVTQQPVRVTCRRCFVDWQGSINVGPKQVYTLIYNTANFRCENCIAMRTGVAMPDRYFVYHDGAPWCITGGGAGCRNGSGTNYSCSAGTIVGNKCEMTNGRIEQPDGHFGMDQNVTGNANLNPNLFGSLAILRSVDKLVTSSGAGSLFHIVGITASIEVDHLVLYNEQSATPTILVGQNTLACPSGQTCPKYVRNLTSIKPSGSSITTATGWGTSWGEADNVFSYASLSAATSNGRNPWTTNDGANLCNRWGTSTALWPWPMNQRIKDATASAGAYTGPCPECRKTDGTPFVFPVRPQLDVTAIVEAALGPIPSQCRGITPDPDPEPEPDPVPSLSVGPSTLSFSGAVGSTIPSQSFIIENTVAGTTMSWVAGDDVGWLSVAPSSGVNTALVTAHINTAGLAAGIYLGTITVAAPGATNNPIGIPVVLTILPTTSPATRSSGTYRR